MQTFVFNFNNYNMYNKLNMKNFVLYFQILGINIKNSILEF